LEKKGNKKKEKHLPLLSPPPSKNLIWIFIKVPEE